MSKRSSKIVDVQTQYGLYRCVLELDGKRGFIVTVPGLDGVITWGKNTAHAKEMAREAIELCVECRVQEALPRTKTRLRVGTREPVAV